MSIWSKLFGVQLPPAADMPGEASARDKTQAEAHRDRFARALVQAKIAVARAEKDPSRIDELQRWHDYYAGLVQLEAGLNPASEEEAG